MEKFILDSHKLHYHLDRVAEFQKNGDCYPIYMEVSPVGLCNHRCIFCAYDYIDYPNRHLDKDRFLSFLDEVASLGLKSILYAGEGEPLIHKNITDFVISASENACARNKWSKLAIGLLVGTGALTLGTIALMGRKNYFNKDQYEPLNPKTPEGVTK